MALGSALLITGGVDQRDVPFKLIDTSAADGRSARSYLVLIAAAVALVFGVILAATRFGRYTYAIGSNEEAVRRAGVNVDAHLIKVYAIGGTLPGSPASCRSRASAPRRSAAISTDNLDAISAVVIGGTSLFGGIGTIVGTVVGVFILPFCATAS